MIALRDQRAARRHRHARRATLARAAVELHLVHDRDRPASSSPHRATSRRRRPLVRRKRGESVLGGCAVAIDEKRLAPGRAAVGRRSHARVVGECSGAALRSQCVNSTPFASSTMEGKRPSSRTDHSARRSSAAPTTSHRDNARNAAPRDRCSAPARASSGGRRRASPRRTLRGGRTRRRGHSSIGDFGASAAVAGAMVPSAGRAGHPSTSKATGRAALNRTAPPTLARALRLDVAIARLRVRHQRIDQSRATAVPARPRDRTPLICLRRLVESRELSHELQRRRLDFSSVAGGSKLNSVLMFLHMTVSCSATILTNSRG